MLNLSRVPAAESRRSESNNLLSAALLTFSSSSSLAPRVAGLKGNYECLLRRPGNAIKNFGAKLVLCQRRRRLFTQICVLACPCAFKLLASYLYLRHMNASSSELALHVPILLPYTARQTTHCIARLPLFFPPAAAYLSHPKKQEENSK